MEKLEVKVRQEVNATTFQKLSPDYAWSICTQSSEARITKGMAAMLVYITTENFTVNQL